MTGRLYFVTLLMALNLIGCGPVEQEQGDEPGEAHLIFDRWPGEGVPVLAWQGPGDSLKVYLQLGDTDSARAAARAGRQIPVTAGRKLLWDRSAIQIEQPGQMKITDDCIICGFVYDPPEGGRLHSGRARDIYLPSGTLLEVICYAAEGFYIFRHDGEFIEMGVGHSCQRMLAEPRTRWWVQITRDGNPAGWVPVDGTAVAVVERRF